MNKLPKKVNVSLSGFLSEDVCMEIEEYLASKYGFCVSGYDYTLTVSNIEWDTTE